MLTGERESIVFIKTMEDLEKDAEQRDWYSPFIFANYKVVDKTCNKELKYCVSMNKAETRKARQLAYKKHAKCEVVIEELHLIDNMFVTISDVHGTEPYVRKQGKLEAPVKRSVMMGLRNNINLKGVVKSIISDNVITTRNGPSRKMEITFEDINEDTIKILIWGDMTEGIVEGCTVEIRKAELNTYEYAICELQVSRFGSVKVMYVPEPEKLPELPRDGQIMELQFKSRKDYANFMENVNPQIRDEDIVYAGQVSGLLKIRNPTRYERNGMKVTELGSIQRQPRSKRIDKVEGVTKDNFVTVGVLNDGPYGTKGSAIVENFSYDVIKGDEDKRLSYMDKFSYKCGICGEIYGYQHDAENCSLNHIPYGKMLGEIVTSVKIIKEEIIV